MQPIFSRNRDYRKIAFLNWRIHSHSSIRILLNIADGYLSAAIELAKLCLIDNEDKKADILIFPILTNANHGIELYLKAYTWILNKLLKTEQRIEGKHNIQQIFKTVKSKLKQYKGNQLLKEFESENKDLESYIHELFDKVNATEKDDKMDFSRYPISNHYDNHFYVDAVGNVEIDLENFLSRFQIIKDKLETFGDFLYYDELNQND